jgi:AcrR family transcriptional regulator
LRNPEKDNKEKERILNHITKKFQAEGFYKTSMDEIAGDLRVSKKTIYKYFPSKDELLETVCLCTYEEITSDINKILFGNEDVIYKIVKIINLYSKFTLGLSEKWINDLRIHSPHITNNLITKRNKTVTELLEKLFEQGKKEKLFENYPAVIVVNTFNAVLYSLLHTDFIMNNRFSLLEASRYTFDILFNGILTQKGREKYLRTKKEIRKEIKL